MFTGLVEEVGTILSIEEKKGNSSDFKKFRISCNKIRTGLKKGDSININGACQTVLTYSTFFSKIKYKSHWFEIESWKETLEKTNFRDLKIGSEVNLERALRLQDRLGGHIVTGHVMGTTRKQDLVKEDTNTYLYLQLSDEMLRYCIKEGSIAINGISVTIADIIKNTIKINIISHTLAETNLRSFDSSQRLNIEVDSLLKYTAQLVSNKNK